MYPLHPVTGEEVTYAPDGTWDGVAVEVARHVKGARDLRASLMGLAYWVASGFGDRGVLVLLDPDMTPERIRSEERLARETLRADVADRLHVAVRMGESYVGLPDGLGAAFQAWLGGLVQSETGRLLPRPPSYFVVLGVLLHEWLLDREPRTTKWLMESTGYSYPTVADALDRMGAFLTRSSDRRVQLTDDFPRLEWERLVMASDDVRSTIRFVDRSGLPRSPEKLLQRLRNLNRKDVAVGGAYGARHYKPDLDLVGAPRLDLSLHAPGRTADLDFVRHLDPALEESADRREAAGLVVHLVRRAEPFFERGDDGLLVAGPVE
ncbi:MAG TPA: hypothetical protein VK610_05310, partial [Rhodothermales bacterium]|nr:hypothetical protein [Rhodothermales bacterium]